MARTITFSNHRPMSVSDESRIETVWDGEPPFGWHRLKRYTTKTGKHIYWITFNNGNQDNPSQSRTYLATVQDIRDYFYEQDLSTLISAYHREVEPYVDPASIIDVDAIA